MRYLFVISLCLSMNAGAAPSDTTGLFNTLRMNDSLLFEVGFNHCDLRQFDVLLSDNFEFYHDEAGVISSKPDFIESVRNNICKLSYKAERRLVKGTLRVYPLMKNGILYGAVQTGTHEFYSIEGNKPPMLTSTALFSHVWLLQDGKWKLSRCLSYDHRRP